MSPRTRGRVAGRRTGACYASPRLPVRCTVVAPAPFLTQAGRFLVSGSNNIYLKASAAAPTETQTLRIGSGVAIVGVPAVTRAFIAGIRGVTTGIDDAIPVFIDSAGQLGTISSSARTKENIQPVGELSRKIFDLRPVRFTYKPPFGNGDKPTHYGLIAEEVEQVLPELVAYSDDGTVETVKYHLLPTLLLAEVQRLEQERAAQAAELEAQAAELAALSAKLHRLQRALLATMGCK